MNTDFNLLIKHRWQILVLGFVFWDFHQLVHYHDLFFIICSIKVWIIDNMAFDMYIVIRQLPVIHVRDLVNIEIGF